MTSYESKTVKRSIMKEATASFKSLLKNERINRVTSGLWSFRFLFFEAICTPHCISPALFLFSKDFYQVLGYSRSNIQSLWEKIHLFLKTLSGYYPLVLELPSNGVNWIFKSHFDKIIQDLSLTLFSLNIGLNSILADF